MAVIHLTNESFDPYISGGLVLVDFWAEWCTPCRMQAPILDDLDNQLEGKLKIGKINTDDFPEIAERFGVFSIPTMIIFRDGSQIDKCVGVHTAEQLMAKLG